MTLLKNIKTLYTCPLHGEANEIGTIDHAAIVWHGRKIIWVGQEADLPADLPHTEEVIDAKGQIVIPGLVDCHTHLAFGGWRENEFAMRCQGVGYLEIAKRGGGIACSVEQLRGASEETLLAHCQEQSQKMAKLGVTTIECKSGYGLSTESELKTLRVYQQLSKIVPQTIVSTFLGAHVVPTEYKRDPDGYLDLLCEELLPQVAEEKLATFCDVFVEEGAYSIDQGRRFLTCGQKYGLKAKLHVDQLTSGGGAELAAEMRAVSADHLEFASEEGIEKMVEAGVVAVNLPLASLYLKQPPLDSRKWIRAGGKVAVATDFNPGSAPSYHLPLAMMLSCVMSYMTPEQSLKGATIYGAKAIGLEEEIGSLEVGKKADLVILDSPSIDHWLYHFEPNRTSDVFISGKQVVANGDLV
ncbi:MAG: imidazolonepropionase [Pirellulaceae bacterium]|nr:imidazolonepropionase [Pirellulaceae bacterium]